MTVYWAGLAPNRTAVASENPPPKMSISVPPELGPRDGTISLTKLAAGTTSFEGADEALVPRALVADTVKT